MAFFYIAKNTFTHTPLGGCNERGSVGLARLREYPLNFASVLGFPPGDGPAERI